MGSDGGAAVRGPPLEHAFAEALDALQDGFLVLDPGWRVAFANRTAADRLRIDPREIVGAVIWERFPQLRGTAIESAYRRVMQERQPLSLELGGAFSDHWYRVGISPCGPGICVLWTDITALKRAQQALEAQLAAREQLARIAAAVPGAICSFELRPDGTSCMPFAAEGIEDVYGIAREALARDAGPLFAAVHPEDAPALQHSIVASARDGTLWHAEFRYLHPGKGLRWIEGWSAPSRRPDGTVIWHGYVTDVSDRKQAEASLQESERRATARAAELQAVLDTVPAVVWISRDPAGSVVDGNRFAADLLRLPEGANMSITAPPGARPTTFHVFRDGVELTGDDLPIQAAARHGTEIRDFPLDLVFEDGTVRHLLGNAAPIRQGDRTVGSVGAFLDVTSRRGAEERDRAAAARDGFRLRLADALRPLTDPAQISATASRLLASFLGADRVGYGEVRGDEVVAADDFHAPGLASAAGRHRIADYGPTVAAAMRAGRTIVVHDVAATGGDDARLAMSVAWSIRAWVNVPVLKGGTFAACLVVARCAPHRWSDEEVTLLEEVAERTWAAVERARAEAALRDEARRKDEFLAVLSHELRNPLAPIRNSVYVLARSAPGSSQALRAMEVLRRQTEHVTRLVDDLLDVTRISRGKIELRRARVDLRAVVRRTGEDLGCLFAEAGVALRVEQPARPAWVEADRTRVAQVLANLLQNAAKFTPRGRAVAVSIEVREGSALLRVRDEGVGIEPSQLGRMFEPFTQADQGIARSKGGLGLGLALVKALVELHGGTVSARSEGAGRGAEFTVALPCCPEIGAERERAVSRPGAPLDVLVVEDNADSAETLADLLTILGHRVRVATDGRSGLALARALRPQVVLCDIGLPDLDGYEVARAIRADEGLRGTRLVALTGYALPEDRQRAVDAGFDAHAAKPVEPDDLARLVGG